MKQQQPRGPYLIGGHCDGCWVAYEMAVQLDLRQVEQPARHSRSISVPVPRPPPQHIEMRPYLPPVRSSS